MTLTSTITPQATAPLPVARLLLPPTRPATSEALARAVVSTCYTTIDAASPTARLRGTFLQPAPGGGLDVAGWQRNVARVQKMDVVLPTVLRLRLDTDDVVVSAGLEASFAGSRGLLCYHPYVDRRVREGLVGRRFGEDLAAQVTVSGFACFHVAEVLSDLLDARRLMAATGAGEFFEQECVDAVQTGDVLTMFGHQAVLGGRAVTYRVVVEGALTSIRFGPEGGIRSTEPLTVRTFLEEELVGERSVGGGTPAEFILSVQRATRPLLRAVGASLGAPGPGFACSNLAPRSFVGAFVQALAGKLYANNYTYILHCLSGLQRQDGRPRCVGGLRSQDEADEHFPGFSISDAICGG